MDSWRLARAFCSLSSSSTTRICVFWSATLTSRSWLYPVPAVPSALDQFKLAFWTSKPHHLGDFLSQLHIYAPELCMHCIQDCAFYSSFVLDGLECMESGLETLLCFQSNCLWLSVWEEVLLATFAPSLRGHLLSGEEISVAYYLGASQAGLQAGTRPCICFYLACTAPFGNKSTPAVCYAGVLVKVARGLAGSQAFIESQKCCPSREQDETRDTVRC